MSKIGWLTCFFTATIGFDVESGNDFESFLFKSTIGYERQPQVADSNQNHWLQAAGTYSSKSVSKVLRLRIRDRGCRTGQGSQVFAELSGFNARDFGEHLAGDGLDFVVFEPRQAAQIK